MADDSSASVSMQFYGKLGEGAYMNNALAHHTTASAMMQHGLRHILGDLVIPSDRPFVLCDYGAADGGASHDVIADIIDYLRREHPKLEICVMYMDQPEADYVSLFKLLNGKLGKEAYQQKVSDVYISAVGGTFYKQCLPHASVHLAISTTAMHWLSRIPCQLTQSVASGSRRCPEEERKLYNQQMVDDLTVNLLHRAKEMVRGSYIVIALPTEYMDGHHVSILEALWMMYVKMGRITQMEFLNSNLQCADLSHEELLGLFAEGKAVPAAGLKLMKLSKLDFPCPMVAKFTSGQWTAEEYASSFVACKKNITYSIFYDTLNPSRPHAVRENIVQQLFADYAKTIATDPRSFPMAVKSHLMVIKKVL